MRFQGYTVGTVAALATLATAFPGMAGMKDQIKYMNEVREAAAAAAPEPEPEPQVVGPIVGGLIGQLTNTVEGLLGQVFQGAIVPSDKRPEPGFPYKAPGPNDSRGPCPGLNTLANHGYLPRNGYVSAAEILEATSRGFNMGPDLATVLIIFAVLTDGSIKDRSWWLGTDPSTGVGGLNRHSTVEVDISPNREDFYNGCGDNHHLSSRMFTRNVNIVSKRPSKQFDIPAMASHFAAQGNFVKKYNPTLYYFPFPMIVSVVAYNFYPRFFSNGTSELGGVANYESISSIVGAKYNKKKGMFQYVPERFPQNWYRRNFPYTATQALLEGFTQVYPANPILPPGFFQLPPEQTFTITNLVCNLKQGLNSITPLALAGQEAQAEEGVQWALELLDEQFHDTLLGCPQNSVSLNYYPYPNRTGGPLAPGPAVQKNAGNNVYNKIYFPTAPKTPQCDHIG